MAPELEEGGQLDVSPAADIYSLGKVIYYMISGGIVLPRERLNEPQFSKILETGQRYHLLGLLLGRMICPVGQRISDTAQALDELKKIEEWEKNAELIPMSAAARDAARKLQRLSVERGRIAEENTQARQHEATIRGAVQQSVTDWLTTELNKLVPAIACESITCSVKDAAMPQKIRIQTGHNSMYTVLNGVEFVIDDMNDVRNCTHSLQFFLCQHIRSVVTIRSGPATPLPEPSPPRDAEFAIVVLYRQTLKHPPNNASTLGYLSRAELVGTMRARVQIPQPGIRGRGPSPYRVARVMPAFEPDVSLHVDFRASEWPTKENSVRMLIGQASELFLAIVGS